MGLSTKLLAEGETPLVVLRPHVRRLFWPAVLVLLLAPATAYAAGAVPAGGSQPTIRWVVAAVAGVIALRWVVWPFVLWWNTIYVLTDERLFERAGVVRRTGHDLPLRGVADVLVAQRLAERVLRSGTLTVTTEGGAEFTVTDVPGVTRLQRSLLAVADDVAERFAARPPRRVRRRDENDDRPGGRYLEVGRAGAPAPAGHDGPSDDRDDLRDHPDDLLEHPGDPDDLDDDGRPGRRQVRRRERESARRLRALQEQVRRTPALPVPDSPVEDDAAPPDPIAPAAAQQEPAAGTAGDPGDGARILRFPRRP